MIDWNIVDGLDVFSDGEGFTETIYGLEGDEPSVRYRDEMRLFRYYLDGRITRMASIDVSAYWLDEIVVNPCNKAGCEHPSHGKSKFCKLHRGRRGKEKGKA